jgi:hypothetical protein
MYLAGRVDDLGGVVFALKPYDFAEGVFDSGVVGFDEVAVNELDRERGFAYSTACVVRNCVSSGLGVREKQCLVLNSGGLTD